MHKDISVAVPTRHRPICMHNFIVSFYSTVSQRIPHVHVIHDAPETKPPTPSAYCVETINYDKSSLTELWNQCIIQSPTDWILICNDDITFLPGWLEYLEEQIATKKYLLIHLFHYGAFCIHKSLILKMGWFDERFRGGGFEDIDHMLRLSELGLKEMVDRSHDFIKNEGDVEIAHFIKHHKKSYHNSGATQGTGWQGKNNSIFIMAKWGRTNNVEWRIPSFRMMPEIDWHPTVTNKYEAKFNMPAMIRLQNPTVTYSNPVFP